MFMCHVAHLIDEAEFRLCIECAELFPLRKGNLFVCEAASSDVQEIARHVPERGFDIKKFCEFLNTPPDGIVLVTAKEYKGVELLPLSWQEIHAILLARSKTLPKCS